MSDYDYTDRDRQYRPRWSEYRRAETGDAFGRFLRYLASRPVETWLFFVAGFVIASIF